MEEIANSRQQLADAIESAFETPEDATVVIFEWDAPFGPGFDPFDSYFCQPSALEHGRFAVYPEAKCVINADDDESINLDIHHINGLL